MAKADCPNCDQLQKRLDAAKKVIEGAVDVNLELQVQRSKLLEALDAAKGFIVGQRAFDNLGMSDHTIAIIDAAVRRASVQLS